jgi:hypothetical protein
MSVAGRSEIRISGSDGYLFTGIGPLGWRRRFSRANIKDVRIEPGNRGESNSQIVIEEREGKKIRFGSTLPDEQKKFMASALRKVLIR